jgi:Tfp pilus assembly protein PilF
MLQLRVFAHEPSPPLLRDATMHLSRAVELVPNSPEAHFYLALALSFTLDTIHEADHHLQHALSLNPQLEARATEIQQRINAGRAGMQQQAIEPDALHAAVQRYERAQTLLDTGRADEAVALLNEAIALYPAYAEAMLAIGDAYRQLQRPDEAITAFRRALAVRPNMFQAYVGLGTLYVQRGDHHRALEQLQLALQQQPDQPQVLRNVGLLQLATGSASDALATFRRLCALSPDDPEPRLQLALAALKAGDQTTARESLHRVDSTTLTAKQHRLAAQIAVDLGDQQLADNYRRLSEQGINDE